MTKESTNILGTIIEKHYSNIYEINIAENTITEYLIADMTALKTVPFHQWINEIVSNLQFIQIKPFTEQTQISQVILELQENPFYLVEYQSKMEQELKCFQLIFCYADENKERILLTKQDITSHRTKRQNDIIELEKDSARFRFIISHLCENFGEIHISTGKTWMTTCNDWEVSQGNLKAQIDWFADNLIVPEQKELYLKDFELDHLVETLRKNNGFYAPTYKANYPDGTRYLLIINALMNSLENPEEDYIFSCVQDITQLKTQEEKNKHLLDISQELMTLSPIEPLTKLYNRIAGEKMIRDYLQSKSKYAIAALLVVDIDYFKQFNDQYGHPTGDSVLKYLAATMQSVFRASDILCRWGGDEFAIFMPDISGLSLIEELIETLQSKMSKHRINQTSLPITISVGGVMFKKATSLEHLYEEADMYLYQVKSSGRNNYHIVVND